jgi:hypothetical protein
MILVETILAYLDINSMSCPSNEIQASYSADAVSTAHALMGPTLLYHIRQMHIRPCMAHCQPLAEDPVIKAHVWFVSLSPKTHLNSERSRFHIPKIRLLISTGRTLNYIPTKFIEIPNINMSKSGTVKM